MNKIKNNTIINLLKKNNTIINLLKKNKQLELIFIVYKKIFSLRI